MDWLIGSVLVSPWYWCIKISSCTLWWMVPWLREISPFLNRGRLQWHLCHYIANAASPAREGLPVFPCSPCGDANARSLQDNSKIRPCLLLLMSGGRSCNPVAPRRFVGQSQMLCPGLLLSLSGSLRLWNQWTLLPVVNWSHAFPPIVSWWRWIVPTLPMWQQSSLPWPIATAAFLRYSNAADLSCRYSCWRAMISAPQTA